MSKSLLRTDKEIAKNTKRHGLSELPRTFAKMSCGIGGADTRTSRISTISPAQKISKQMIFSKWLWNSPKSIRPWSICIIMKDIPAWKSQAS